VGVRDSNFDSWKTWEHGAPELCVEVLARDTSEYLSMREKRARYRTLGVRELVVFNFSAREGKRLQVYDRVRGDLVERFVARRLPKRSDWPTRVSASSNAKTRRSNAPWPSSRRSARRKVAISLAGGRFSSRFRAPKP
jgi:hypothetical protein